MLWMLMVNAALAGFPKAPRADNAISPWEIDAADLCFGSGLRVVAVNRPGSGTVRIAAVVEGGLASEGEAHAGAAWAIAGLRPWSRAGDGEPLGGVEIGTLGEVVVHPDAIISFRTAPAGSLREALRREGAWLADPLAGIDEDTLDRTRDTLQTRAFEQQDDGWLAGSHALRRRLYPEDTPEHWLALPGAVQALSLESAQAWVAARHVPSNMTLRLEGDVPTDAGELGELIGEVFPDALFRGKADCAHTREPLQLTPAPGPPQAVEAPVGVTQVHLGWHVPAGFDPDAQWLERFADVISARMRSRATPLLSERHKRSWLTSGCAVDVGARASVLHCSFDLPGEAYAERVSKALVTGIPNRVQSEEIALAFGSAGFHGVANLPQELAAWDDASGYASITRALSTHFTGKFEATWALDAAVTLDAKDMTRKALDHVTEDRVAVVILVPMEVNSSSEPAPAEPPFPLPADPGPLARPDVSAVTEHTTNGGLRVWLDPRDKRTMPVAHARLLLQGGIGAERETGADRALAAVRGSRNGYQAHLVENRSGSWTSRFRTESAVGVNGRAASANLPALAWLVRHDVDVPFADFHEEDQRTYIEYAIDNMLGTQPEKTPPPYPRRISDPERWQTLLPDHPAGVPWWDRYDAARQVNGGVIRDQARATYRADNGILVVTSHGTAPQLKGPIDKYLGKWRGLEPPEEASPARVAGPLPDRTLRIYPSLGTTTRTTVACRVAALTAGSRPTLDVLRAALHTQLGLRPDLVVVSVSVDPVDDGVAVLEVELASPPQRTSSDLTTLLRVIAATRTGLSADELAAARVRASLAHAFHLADGQARAQGLASFALQGSSLQDLSAHPDRLAGVTADQVSEALEDCVGHEVISVVGPAPQDGFDPIAPKVESVDWAASMMVLGRALK